MRLGGGGGGGGGTCNTYASQSKPRGCLCMMSSVGIAIDPSVDKETIVWVMASGERERTEQGKRRKGQGCKGEITSEGVK